MVTPGLEVQLQGQVCKSEMILTPMIPALGGLRQEDFCELKASVGYSLRLFETFSN